MDRTEIAVDALDSFGPDARMLLLFYPCSTCRKSLTALTVFSSTTCEIRILQSPRKRMTMSAKPCSHQPRMMPRRFTEHKPTIRVLILGRTCDEPKILRLFRFHSSRRHSARDLHSDPFGREFAIRAWPSCLNCYSQSSLGAPNGIRVAKLLGGSQVITDAQSGIKKLRLRIDTLVSDFPDWLHAPSRTRLRMFEMNCDPASKRLVSALHARHGYIKAARMVLGREPLLHY